MRFLFSVDKNEYGTTSVQADEAPEAGEPLVPWFPAPAENSFVSCTSFKRTPYAVVADKNIDPDELLANLIKQYPGLPERLHRVYISKVAVVVHKIKPGTKFRVMIGADSAAIQQVDDEVNIIELWNKQPIEG